MKDERKKESFVPFVFLIMFIFMIFIIVYSDIYVIIQKCFIYDKKTFLVTFLFLAMRRNVKIKIKYNFKNGKGLFYPTAIKIHTGNIIQISFSYCQIYIFLEC